MFNFLKTSEVSAYYEARIRELDRGYAVSWSEVHSLRKQVEDLQQVIVTLTTRKVQRQREYIHRLNRKRGLEKQAAERGEL